MKSIVMRALGALLAGALLAGCDDQVLYSKLTEQQANEMVAALRGAGLPADKAAREGEFEVSTSKEHFAQAVRTLAAQGLPREPFDSLGKVFKREGFISSPLEERSRLLHALSQELSHTVSSIDGVVLARVTLAVPEKHPLQDKTPPASASVLIKHRAGMDVDALVPKVKALVVNGVEGLPYENVTVVPFVAEAPAPEAAPATAAAAAPLQTPLAASALLGIVALAGAGGLHWWRRRQLLRLSGPRRAPELAAAKDEA